MATWKNFISDWNLKEKKKLFVKKNVALFVHLPFF